MTAIPITSINRPLSREEEADQALRNTVLHPRAARLFVATFLLPLFLAPIAQIVIEKRRNPTMPPQPFEVVTLLPSRQAIFSVRTPLDAFHLLPPEDAIRAYEDDLENGSILSEWVTPRVQAILAGMGAGNEQAYIGSENWLFYRPDVDHLTGRGFLDPAVLTARSRKGEGQAIQPNPLPAIQRFRRQLAARGIELIVLPTPSKPMIHPDRLSSRLSPEAAPLRNPSHGRFVESLRREGIRVFDPSEFLVERRRRTGDPQYLEADTHWSPAAMEATAGELARTIVSERLLPNFPPVAYHRGAKTVSQLGDVALMLKLPEDQALFRPQRVEIHPVYDAAGNRWRVDQDADVLLLGDSYSNIYSLEGMGWGESAGLAEQLSAALRRPIDRIVINDGGAHTTRRQLQRDLLRGRDRLRGKKVVVWQFAIRNLSEGDWKRLDLPDLAKPSSLDGSSR